MQDNLESHIFELPKETFSDSQIIHRVDIASSVPVHENPNQYNCAGFVVYVLGENSIEDRIDPDGQDMEAILKRYKELAETDEYDIDLAEKSKFVGIRYKFAFPNNYHFDRYSHFALPDPTDKSFLFQRKSGGAKVERLRGDQALKEFLVPMSIGGINKNPQIVYFG